MTFSHRPLVHKHARTHTHSWYFGDISRAESEKLLLAGSNPSGTFLIRTSSSRKDTLSLSLRDGDVVKHYRIRRLDNGEFYVAAKITFLTLKVSFNCVYIYTSTFVFTYIPTCISG